MKRQTHSIRHGSQMAKGSIRTLTQPKHRIMLILSVVLLGLLALSRPVWPNAQQTAAAGPTLTIVYDNTVSNTELRADWGFSCLVQTAEATLLFDAGGDGELLMKNLDNLGIDPSGIDMVVLSHAHWDHTAGLEAFLRVRGPVDVYLPASLPPFHQRDIARWGARIFPITASREIADGVFSTGELSGAIREQALIVSTSRGLIVITGCAHPGVERIVSTALDLLDKPVLLLVGGFHLLHADPQMVQTLIERLKALGVRYVAPCHCTGDAAISAFKKTYAERCLSGGAGQVIAIDQLP